MAKRGGETRGGEPGAEQGKITDLKKRWEAVVEVDSAMEPEVIGRMKFDFAAIPTVKNDRKRLQKITELEGKISAFEKALHITVAPRAESKPIVPAAGVDAAPKLEGSEKQKLLNDDDQDTIVTPSGVYGAEASPIVDAEKDWGTPNVRAITAEDADSEIAWAKGYPELTALISDSLDYPSMRVYFGAYFRVFHEKNVTVPDAKLGHIALTEAVWATNEYNFRVAEDDYIAIINKVAKDGVDVETELPELYAKIEAAHDTLANAIELSIGDFAMANEDYLKILSELQKESDRLVVEKKNQLEQERRKKMYETVQQVRADVKATLEYCDINPQEFFPDIDERVVRALDYFEQVKDGEIAAVQAAQQNCLLAFSELHAAVQEYLQSPNAASADLEKTITRAEAEQALEWAKREYKQSRGKYGLNPNSGPKNAKDLFEWGAYWRTMREGQGKVDPQDLKDAADRNGECARRVFVERQLTVWFEALCKKAENAGVATTLFDRYVKGDPEAGKLLFKKRNLAPLETLEAVRAYDEAHAADLNAPPFDLVSQNAQRDYRNKVARTDRELQNLDREMSRLVKEKTWADPANPERARLIAELAPEIALNDTKNALPLSQMTTAADTYGFSPDARRAIQNVLTNWETEQAAIIQKLAKFEEAQHDSRIAPAKVKAAREAIVRQSALLTEKIQKGIETYVVPELKKQTQAEIATMLPYETVRLGSTSKNVLQIEERICAELMAARLVLEVALENFLSVANGREQFLEAHEKYQEAVQNVQRLNESLQPVRDAAKNVESYVAARDRYNALQHYVPYLPDDVRTGLVDAVRACDVLLPGQLRLQAMDTLLMVGDIPDEKLLVAEFAEKVRAFEVLVEKAVAGQAEAEKALLKEQNDTFIKEIRQDFIRFQELRREYEGLKKTLTPKDDETLLKIFRSEIALRDEFVAKFKAAGSTAGLEEYKITYKNKVEHMQVALKYVVLRDRWQHILSDREGEMPKNVKQRIEANLAILDSFYTTGATVHRDTPQRAAGIDGELGVLESTLPPKKIGIFRAIGKRLFG